MGSADALQEGMMAPSGVTASEPEEPAEISPASPSTATHSNRGHPTIKPPASTRHHSLGHIHAAPLRTPPRGQGGRKEAPSDGRNHTEAKREGTTSPADVREARAPGDVVVADRTWQQGTPGHPWPGQVHNGPAKPRRPCCSKPAPAPPAPSRQRRSPASWRPRRRPVPPPARPNPDGARRAQIWAERAGSGRAAPLPTATPSPSRPPTPRQDLRRHVGPPPPKSTPRRTPPRAGEHREGKGRRPPPPATQGPGLAAGAGDGGGEGGREGGALEEGGRRSAAGRPRGRRGRARGEELMASITFLVCFFFAVSFP